MKRIEENLLELQKKLKRVYTCIGVIIFIHTITIFQITLRSFLGGVKGHLEVKGNAQRTRREF